MMGWDGEGKAREVGVGVGIFVAWICLGQDLLLFMLQKEQICIFVYLSMRPDIQVLLLYQQQSLKADFLTGLYRTCSSSFSQKKSEESATDESINKLIDENGKLHFEMDTFDLRMVDFKVVPAGEVSDRINLILLQVNEEVNQQTLARVGALSAKETISLLLVDKPTSKLKSTMIENYFIAVTELLRKECNTQVKKENCLQICISENKGIKQEFVRRMKQLMEHLAKNRPKVRLEEVQKKMIKILQNYQVQDQQQCLKQLLQGNIEEASIYIKRPQRSKFREEVSTCRQFRQYFTPAEKEEIAVESPKEKAMKQIEKLSQIFGVKQKVKEDFTNELLEKQMEEASLKIERKQRDAFKSQIADCQFLQAYWKSLEEPVTVEQITSSVKSDGSREKQEATKTKLEILTEQAQAEVKKVIEMFSVVEAQQVESLLMTGDLESALKQIPTKQKQAFKTNVSNNLKLKQLYAEMKKGSEGQKNEEEDLKKVVFKLFKKYNVKNEEECLEQLLNNQFEDALLKISKADRPKFQDQVKKCASFQKLLSLRETPAHSGSEIKQRIAREQLMGIVKKYKISNENENEFIEEIIAKNLDDAIIKVKKSERENLRSEIQKLGGLRNLWESKEKGEGKEQTKDPALQNKRKVEQKYQGLLKKMQVIEVQDCLKLILEGKIEEALTEVPKTKRSELKQTIEKCAELKAFYEANKPKQIDLKEIALNALTKICLQNEVKNVDQCLEQILSNKLDDALVNAPKRLRDQFSKQILSCQQLKNYKMKAEKSEAQDLENNAKSELAKIMKQYSVVEIEDCIAEILQENYEEAKFNVKKDVRQKFIADCLNCPQYQQYQSAKKSSKQASTTSKICSQLKKILKTYIVDYQSCLPLIENGQIEQVVQQVKPTKRQQFMNQLRGCKSYCEIMKEFEANQSPAVFIAKVLQKNKVAKEKITQLSELVIKGKLGKLKSETNPQQYNCILKDLFSDKKIVSFLAEGQNEHYYDQASYFYTSSLGIKQIEGMLTSMTSDHSETQFKNSKWLSKYFKQDFDEQIQTLQKQILNIKDCSFDHNQKAIALISAMQSIKFLKCLKQYKKIDQKLSQIPETNNLSVEQCEKRIAELQKFLSQSGHSFSKVAQKQQLEKYSNFVKLTEKKRKLLRKLNAEQDIDQVIFVMNEELLKMEMSWGLVKGKVAELTEIIQSAIKKEDEEGYYKNKERSSRLQKFALLHSYFPAQICSIMVPIVLFGKANSKIPCKKKTNLRQLYSLLGKASQKNQKEIILEVTINGQKAIMKNEDRLIPRPEEIRCHGKIQINFQLKGKFYQLSTFESIGSEELRVVLLEQAKTHGFSSQSPQIEIFGVFQGNSSLIPINEQLSVIRMKQPTNLKYLKIKPKVSVIVYYEEEYYSFINDPEDDISKIKEEVLDKIKVPIKSQSLLYLKGEQQHQVFNQKINELEFDQDVISFRLISKMNLEHYGFHENFALTYQEFSKFFISEEGDIKEMVKTCDLKKEQEKNFFDQLIRHLYASIKRKFKFSHVTNDIKLKIMEKYSQQIWSGGDFNDYFILYYILFNAEEKLRIEFMNITNSMFPLPLYFRVFNNINDVKSEWRINDEILWILQDGLCITSVGLHTKNIENETGKTYLNNKIFHTNFQRKKEKHPITFGCPEITLKIFGSVVPINFIDIPSSCEKGISENIIKVSNFLIVHSWLDLAQTQKMLAYYSSNLGVKNVICFMRDSKNKEQTNLKVNFANFQKNPILSLHNLQEYVMDEEKGVAFYKILREKVWQTVKKVNDNLGNSGMIYNLFENPLFSKMQGFSHQISKDFLSIKTVCVKCQEMKRYKSKKYQDSSYEAIEDIKKQITSKGIHPIFKQILLFIESNKKYQSVLMLRFKEILKQVKNAYEKKYVILNLYNKKIKSSNWKKDDEQFKLFKEEVIRNVEALPLMTKFKLTETPEQIQNELAEKIEYFEDQIKSKFFTIEIAWRELQYLTTFDPLYKLGSIYLIDFLIQFKREDITNNQPFELLDGDILETPKNITKKVFEGMNQKVAIITVFGPQSSGKSTLLNFLFGCDFGTSEGRCTKGAYGTYFRFSNLRISGCEGVFLVDTEGLFANVSKKDAEFRKDFDSKLVLFCLAISDFVIINTKGNLDIQSTKIVKSSWQRFGALTQENIDWPELNLVLNQNTSTNTITSEADINKLRELFNVNKSYSLNQAYNLKEISKKDVAILPEVESYVRKQPREQFLCQTNVQQNSLIEQIEEKADFKSIGAAIDLMERVWSTIEAYPDLGKSVSKNIQEIENKIKEWRLKNIEDLGVKKQNLIKLLKADKMKDKDCELEFEEQIKKCKNDYNERYLSEKQLQKLKEQEKLKIELEQNKCLLAFQAIKFELSSEMKDLEKDRLADKCKIEGSQYEIEAIRKVKQLQRNEKRQLTNEEKQVYFEDAFQKSLARIQNISSPEEKLDNYFDRILEFYSSAIENTSSSKKNDKSAGLPRPEWKYETKLNYADFSKQIIGYIFKLIGNDSNKYIEIRNNPPTKVLDESSKTDAKLNYFNMRKYFHKEKICSYYEISKLSLQKSLKERLLLTEISQAKEQRLKFDYGIEDIYKKLSNYLSTYFGICLESMENFKEYFEYKISLFSFRTPELKIKINQANVTVLGVQSSKKKKKGDSSKKNKNSSFNQTTHSSNKTGHVSHQINEWNKRSGNQTSSNQQREQYNRSSSSWDTQQGYGNQNGNRLGQQQVSESSNNYGPWKERSKSPDDEFYSMSSDEDIGEFSSEAEIREIQIYLDIKEFKYKFNQIKNFAAKDKQFLTQNLKKCIKWNSIEKKMKDTERYRSVLSELNKEFMQKINKDLSIFGIECECSNLYQYLCNNTRFQLSFVQHDMPALSKNVTQFYTKLKSLDKFDIHQGIQKNYQGNSANSFYYLKIGKIEQQILEVENNYKNTKELAAYIESDSNKVFYSLKSEKMKNFVYSQLINEKDSSFIKLFKKIDQIVDKSDLVLTRNTITNIYIDVAREVTEFNNDLNQVSQKLTLLFVGYVHLYALYMSWKKFSQLAVKEANKPYNELNSQRAQKLNFFILQTSNSDVAQSNGQSDRFLNEVMNYFKSLIEAEKKKINENQAKKYKQAYPRKIIQEKIDTETFSAGSKIDDWFKYLTSPYEVIKKKYDDLADDWQKNIVNEYGSYKQVILTLEELKLALKSILQKIKQLKIEEGTIHTDIFSLSKRSEKDISITDSLVREKLNNLIMSYFLDLLVRDQKKIYTETDFEISINQKYEGLKVFKEPTPFLQSLIKKLKQCKLSITRLYTFATMVVQKLDEKQTINNVSVNKYENQIQDLLKMSEDDSKNFKALSCVYICKELCPGCQRICGVDQVHTNKHECKYGHQMRALGGVKLSNGDASVIRCEDVQLFNKVSFNGRQMEWKEFKEYWQKKTQGSWSFQDLKANTNKQHFIKAWDAVGKQACEKLQMKWVNSNALTAQQMSMTSSEPIHYIFALDDSGSMSGQKWQDLMKSFQVSMDQIKKISTTTKNMKVSVLIQGSTCLKRQENVDPSAVNTSISPRYEGNNFIDTFGKAETLIRTYAAGSKIRFIFMTDGGDSYPSTQVAAIKSLKSTYPNKIEYSGIEFQTSGNTMKLISQQLGGTNTISYTAAQLTTAYLQIINRDVK